MTPISLSRTIPAVVLALSLAVPGLAGELTTRDLIELHRAGLGEEVLVALVEADGGPFDLAPADLIDLKAEGLSDRVLAAMVRAGRLAPGTDAGYAVASTDCQPSHTLMPVAVPVPLRRGHAVTPMDDGMWHVGPSLGHVAVPRLHQQPTSTVDAIRHAPEGFHPGSTGPRAGSPATRTSGRPPARTYGPTSPATPAAASQPTPGVARSAPQSTPGVARSPAAGEARPATPGVARSSSSRSAGS